jgi:aryl-alcohol dehydrogenase-like predicted oxidoreductase
VQVKEPWENCVTITGAAQAAERAFYADSRMPIFAWSSLAGGFFSGRFRRDNLAEMTSYFDRLCIDSYCYPENFARLERAAALAVAHGVTLPQIALAYALRQPWNIFTLVGCATGDEFAANCAALELALTPAEIAWLEDGGKLTGNMD